MHTTLVLDLSSGSVGAAFVGRRTNSLPELLWARRKNFYTTEASLVALKELLHSVFHKGLKAVINKGYPTGIEHVAVSLSGAFPNDEDFLKRVEEEVIKTVSPRGGVAFGRFSEVLAITSGVESNHLEYILSMDEEITEAVQVENGERKEALIIRFGSRTLAKRLGELTGEPLELALSRVSLYLDGYLIETENSKAEKVLNKFLADWGNALKEKKVEGDMLLLLPQALKSGEEKFVDELMTDNAKLFDTTEFVKPSSANEPYDERLALIAAYSASLFT